MSVVSETIALVTGANKGIGKEISRQLAGKGILVLMAACSPERGEKAATEVRGEGMNVDFIHLDVTDQSTADNAAAEIERRFGRLDIMVNNAGIRPDWGPGSELTVDILRKTFEANVFGVFRVTKALLRLLKKSRHGRIVNMSSGLGSLTWNNDGNSPLPSRHTSLAYSSSKSALNMITVQLANEPKSPGIKVNSADPGFTATDMNQNRGQKSEKESATTPVRLALLPDDGPTAGIFGDWGPEPW